MKAEDYGAVPRAVLVAFEGQSGQQQLQSAIQGSVLFGLNNLLRPRAQTLVVAGQTQSLFTSVLPNYTVNDPSQNGGTSGLDRLMEAVKEKGRSIIQSRPNYIVNQTSSRFSNIQMPASWISSDVLQSEIVNENGREVHKAITINGRAEVKEYSDTRGSKVSGEVTGILRFLFDERTHTRFEDLGSSVLDRQSIRVYSFNTAPVSLIEWNSLLTECSVAGRLWIDPRSEEIVRLEDTTMPIIADFALLKMERRVNFADIRIGAEPIWLPTASDVIYWSKRPISDHLVRTQFSNYRKFQAESSISFK